MFKNKKSARSSRVESSETFRRNSVVVSRTQREVAERKQSVTQRQIDAKRRRAHTRTRRRAVLLIVFAVTLGVLLRMRVGGVLVQPQDPSLTLDNQSTTSYEESARQYVSSQVPLGQSWLINSASLRDSIQSQHPEVKSVYIQYANPLSTGLHVRLDFRKPIFAWKGVDGSTRFIDESGVLFSKNYYRGIAVASLPTVEDQGASSSAAGTVIATVSLTRAISDIYKQLPVQYGAQKVHVAKVVLPRSAREIQAYVTGVPYYVKFSTDRSIEAQIGELGQLLGYLKQTNSSPTQYIDLRVAHKAYYK